MSVPNGFVVYRGPSELDGSPIVAILTGTKRPSENRKTGPMAQLWILVDGAEKPTEALLSGADAGVCGDCPLRGLSGEGRACYVNLGRAPNAVHRGRDSYPYWDGDAIPHAVRLGAYGDPAALPASDLARIATQAIYGHTGYSHQWTSAPDGYSQHLMASVDSREERARAKALGWRTFRVAATPELEPGERWCPATPEGGSKTNCDRCQLCSGAGSGPDIVVLAHGPGAKHIS